MALPIILVNYQINFPGEMTCIPRIGRLYCPNNTLADVTTAGALNPLLTSDQLSILSTDIIAVSASNGNQMYQPVIAAGTGIITLTALGVS
jgi:hypothetical protein